MSDTIGPYVVIRRLGAGGMGEVFLAEDPRLGRQVAIKRPTDAWLATPTARDRLRREARAAARLSHPNIAAIFDVLDDHDRPHIVMEFVQGETLATLMMGGPISPSRMVEIGLQLADALAEAHANSIIHRDLKLGNVILTPNGRVKVLDFGLATSPDAGADRITDTGRVLGTPGYMAPEQILGYSGDERSDIYSVGVMLFGLVAGRLPFDSVDSGGRTLAMLSNEQAPRADVVNPNVPAPAADLIARAMARDPDARFQSARDLHEALVRLQRVLAELPTGPSEVPTGDYATRRRRWRWIVAAGVLVIMGAAVLPVMWRARTPSGPPKSVKAGTTSVIAVLPINVISGDASAAYLGVGFADSLTTELAHLPDVTVVRRDELKDFTGDKRVPLRAATVVGADLIVDASLQVQGSTLRVNAMLYRTDGRTLTTIDALPYEGSTDRLFELQHQLAAGVIATAGLGSIASADTPGTSDPVAQRWYWQGRALLDRADVPGNLKNALDVLTKAVDRDPRFALAHAALAEAALAEYHDTKDVSWVTQALRESAKAIEDDPTLSDVYVSRAKFYQQTGKIDDAIQDAQHAIDIQPTNDNAHELLGDILFDTGKPDARRNAVAQYSEAIRLRPKFAHHYDRLGVGLLRLGRYDEAITALETEVQLQPDNADALQKLGTAYLLKQDSNTALTYYERAIRLRPYAGTYVNVGIIQYDQGKYQDAATSFVEAAKLKGPNESIALRNLGDAYVRLHRQEDAKSQYLASLAVLQADLKVNPTNAANLSLMAVCLAKVGRFAEARARIAEALAINANDGQVLYRQATVLALAGQPTEAIAALDRAIRSGYSVAVASKDYDLNSLHGLAGFQAILQKRLP